MNGHYPELAQQRSPNYMPWSNPNAGENDQGLICWDLEMHAGILRMMHVSPRVRIVVMLSTPEGCNQSVLYKQPHSRFHA
jgi:hypothetical protein